MNSQRKGARGEREWAGVLGALGFTTARRSARMYERGDVAPDVSGGIPGTHCEVKRVERLNVPAAMDQATRDAGAVLVPYVAHRRNRGPWLVTLRAEDLRAFCNRVMVSGARTP